MEQVLHQPEGAKPAADKAAQDSAENEKKSHSVESHLVLVAGEGRLQRSDGTGPQSAWTGIAIQPRKADDLGVSRKDLSRNKALPVSVADSRKYDLHQMAVVLFYRLHYITQGRYTPDK